MRDDLALTPLGPGAAVLAFDVGGTDTKAALIDGSGQILGLSRTPTPLPAGGTAAAVIENIGTLAAGLIAEFPDTTPVAACVTVPGIVDDTAGVGVVASNMSWANVPFRALLGERLGLPVAFTHDVRAAGHAEHTLGAARPFNDVAILVIGTGIAGAILINGRPHVAGGYAGELGHSIVTVDGPMCGCGGRGHLEAISSAGAIARRYAEASGNPNGGPLGGAREVLRLAARGDAIAERIWNEAIDGLAVHLSQLVSVLAFQRRPVLLPAEIGENAGLIGAALLAREVAP